MITNKKIMMLATTDNMLWQFLLPHIKHLQENSNIVECVCAKTGFWFDELKNKHNLVVHEVNFKRSPLKLDNLKAYKQLIKLQKQEHYDLIYCQQPVGGMMGRLIGKKFKIPVIYTAHGFHFFEGCSAKNKLIYKTAEKWLSKYTHTLITINDEDFNSALNMKAKNVEKISGIGMDFSKYTPVSETREEIRNSLGLNESDFAVVTVAEFIKRKNYPTMLKAIQILKSRNRDVKFIICGRGEEETNIKNLIKELDIENNVLLLGFRKDINRILTASDAFMLASFHEGLTLSIIEAMSYSLPCIVSDVRGNRDLIINNKGGFIVETTNETEFANKIEYLLENTSACKSMGEFNKIESVKYSIDAVKKELEKIYNKF